MSYDKHLEAIDVIVPHTSYEKVKEAATACAEITSREVEKECIGFAEWIDVNFRGVYNARELMYWTLPVATNRANEQWTTQELFDLYLRSRKT